MVSCAARAGCWKSALSIKNSSKLPVARLNQQSRCAGEVDPARPVIFAQIIHDRSSHRTFSKPRPAGQPAVGRGTALEAPVSRKECVFLYWERLIDRESSCAL